VFKIKGKVVPVLKYAPRREDIRGVEVQLHVFLTLTIDMLRQVLLE
jgi:hypothetical protein